MSSSPRSRKTTYDELAIWGRKNGHDGIDGTFALVAKGMLEGDSSFLERMIEQDKAQMTITIGRFAGNVAMIDHQQIGTGTGIVRVVKNQLERWGTLQEKTRDFYRKFFVLSDRPDAKGHIVPFDMIGETTPLASLHFHVKKDDSGRTIIVNTLSGLDSAVAGRTLDQVYEFVRTNPPAIAAYFRTPSKRVFPLDVSRFMQEIMNELSTRGLSSKAAKDHDFQLDMSMGGEIYFRNGDGELVRRNTDGSETVFGRDGNAADEGLIRHANCYTAGLNTTDEKCETFVFECLIDEDSAGLDKCLKNYYKKFLNPEDMIRKDIKQMHPMVAYRTLQKFGFRYYTERDEVANAKLRKVESVSHWKKHVLDKRGAPAAGKPTTAATFASIGDGRMEAYLKMMVDFVNANPAILNDRYTGTSREATGQFHVPGDLTSQGVKAYVPHAASASYQLSSVLANRHRLSVLGSSSNNLLNQLSPVSMRSITGVVNPLIYHTGGARGGELVQAGGSVADVAGAMDSNKMYGAHYLTEIFKSLLSQLAARGKTITEGDKQKINKLLNTTLQHEETAFRMVDYIERYARVLDFLGDEEYSSEVVSMGNLKKLVEKYESLSQSQSRNEGRLNKVLVAVQDIIDQDSDETYRAM